MDTTACETADQLTRFLEGATKYLRDKRQRASFATYALGLLTEGERKSMEPMAARACGSAEQAHAAHERLVHFTGSAAWRDQPIRQYAAHYAVDAMQKQ